QQPPRPLSPWERAGERATSRKACIGAVELLERLPPFGECPLPGPPPRGREWVSADFSVAGGLKNNLNLQPLISGRLKKNARNINSGNFSGSLYCQADGTNAASVFSDNL
ncbi:TPA: hypothetical protein ACE6KV_001967, partial [Neisseria gonorrhoeae]